MTCRAQGNSPVPGEAEEVEALQNVLLDFNEDVLCCIRELEKERMTAARRSNGLSHPMAG